MKKILLIFFILIAVKVQSQTTFDFPLQFTDTTSTGDTLSRRVISGSDSMSDTCKKYQVMIMCDDTIQFSYTAAYSSVNTFRLLPNTAILDYTWYSSQVPNIYYKVYGTGTPNVYIRMKCEGEQ